MNAFGSFISKYMTDSGMSTKELADYIGCNRRQIKRWVSGICSPSKRMRIMLADKFERDIREVEEVWFGDTKQYEYKSTSLSGVLYTYMKKRNLTCTDLGDEIGESPENVYSWVSGDCLPSPCNVHTVANLLGKSDIELAYMMVGSDATSKTAMAKILHVLRYSLGLRLSELAEVIDIPNDTLRGWKTRSHVCASRNRIKLAQWLNVSEEYVHKAFKERKPEDITLAELKKLYESVKNKK